MKNESSNGTGAPSMTALMTGIIADGEQLIAQQMALLRLELREDLRKARKGAIFLGVGLGITLVGGLLFCLMPPYLLYWAVPDIPLWACFGITGAVFLLLGGIAVFIAAKKFQAAVALPESMAALKENMTYFMDRK
jgi:uncharacterized membrane protein YqjE